MTRIEAQQNHKLAMKRLEAARKAMREAGLSDIPLATRLQEEMWVAELEAKIAGSLRVRYAP